MTPTARTLKLLRDRGFLAEVVERWIPGGFVRRDYMGIIDIVAINDLQTVGIQSCGQAWSDHVKKIQGEGAAAARAWLACPARKLILIGWRPLKVKRGGVAKRYAPREREFTLADFSDDWLS